MIAWSIWKEANKTRMQWKSVQRPIEKAKELLSCRGQIPIQIKEGGLPRMKKMMIPEGWDEEMTDKARINFLIDSVRHKKYMPFTVSCVPHLEAGFIPILIHEVCDSSKTTGHRGRLVDLITSRGGTLTMLQAVTLTNHKACKCKAVRESLANVLT